MTLHGARKHARRALVCALLLAARATTAQDSVAVVGLGDGVELRMVWVEGGEFVMGSDRGRDVSHSYDASRPEHRVSLRGFYIGAYEVTQAQWRAIMDDDPSLFEGSDSLPVERVTWDEACRFATLLSQRTGRRFRLPTEAEWEYAARGGRRSAGYSYAGCARAGLDRHAWFCVNSQGHTHPVGRLEPNELGLYDMSGNVAEWCQDWMDAYTQAPQSNPSGPRHGDSRILRGGHYYSTSPTCAVFDRAWYVPTGRSEFYGLRLVMEPDDEVDE